MADKVYATPKKRFTTQALIAMRFRREGSHMVKRGACRAELATASSPDGTWWRVQPAVRNWQR